MIVMTFNTQHCTNYITKETDYKIMADTINKFSPDFVALNEMRDTGEAEGFENQTKILSELTGMENYYFAKAIDVYAKSSPYGNALLSKHKILDAVTIPIPDPAERNGSRWYETRCILKANLECGLTVMAVHAGLNGEEKALAIKTILENCAREKCVLLGDFNMHPDEKFFEPLKSVFNDTADIFAKPLLSYPSDAPIKKIDYIFATKDIKVISADIPDVVASDHRPHVAELCLEQSAQ